MKKRNLIIIVAFVIISSINPVLAGPFDWCKKDDINDRQLLNQAKITLVQSITLAERHTREIAISSELEMDEKTNNLIYEVETVGSNQAHEVIIDAVSGKVMSVTIDSDD